MLTETEKRAIDFMIGATSMPVDNARNAMTLRAARPEDRAEVRAMIVAKRAEWRVWLTLNQRKWQAGRRTVTVRSCRIRARRWGDRHEPAAILRAEREAVETRERYVRGRV